MPKELKLRIITGLLIACFFVSISLIGGIWFRIFSVIIGLLVFYEWVNITNSLAISFGEKIVGLFFFCIISYKVIYGYFEQAALYRVFYSIIDFAVSIMSNRSFLRFLGIIYSGLPAIMMAYIRGNDLIGFAKISFILSVVCSADVFAYFIGKSIGGPKMAPNISPGKTWSGAIGGTACSIIVGMSVFYYFISDFFISSFVLSSIISITSQLGDLLASFVKRCFGVKQSGWFLPGHGGVIDRVDGLFFVFLIISIIVFILRISFWILGLG